MYIQPYLCCRFEVEIFFVVFLFLQGVQKKMRRSFCLITLATNRLEGWDIFHLKGGTNSFVWSTKTFL